MKRVVIPLWRLLLLGVILAGLGIAGVRLALTAVDSYRDELTAELARFIGLPLKIGEVRADFTALSLDLVLSRVTAYDERHGGRLWSLRDLRVTFDPWASVRARAPRIAAVTVAGAHWVLHYDPGRMRLELASAVAGGELPLVGEGRLRLRDGRLTLVAGGRILQLYQVTGELEHHAARVRLSLGASLGGRTPGRIELKADLAAPGATLDRLRGRFYLHLRALDPHALAALLPALARVGGRVSARAWGDWAEGAPQALRVRFRAAGLSPGAGGALDLDGRLGWRREARGWWLGWGMAGQGTPVDRLELRRHGHSWQLGLEGLDLARTRRWLAALAPALPIHEALAGLDPSGRLKALRLAWTDRDHWRAEGRLQAWTSAPWRRLPGIRGLDLGFHIGPAGGTLEPRGRGLVLNLPALFRWPLEFTRYGGRIAVRARAASGWRLACTDFLAENADVSSRSRFRLDLPEEGSPVLDLQTAFHDGVGGRATRYLPVGGVTPPEVVAWLDRAIVSGRVPAGTLLWRGPLAGYPFADGSGLFEVLFGVEDLILDYREGWPRLEQVEAEVRFHQQGLSIAVTDGRLLESRIERARIRIPDLQHADAIRVQGRVSGPFGDVFRILRESPLAGRLAYYVEGLEPQGDSRLDLGLRIPLEDRVRFRLNGRLRWRDAGLALPDWGIRLHRLQGEARLEDGRLHARGLRARLWGHPVTLRLDTGTASGGVQEVRVNADLTLDTADLAQRFPAPGWSALSGHTPAHLALAVALPRGPDRGPEVDYDLRSALQGIGVHLPAPLGKAAAAARPLRVRGHLPLAPGAPLGIDYGDIHAQLALALLSDGGIRLQGADIRCGKGQSQGPLPARLSLRGRLQRLDLEAWWRWYRHHSGEATGGLGVGTRDLGVDLRVGRLRVFGLDLRNAGLNLERMPQGWDLGLTSEPLQGRVRVPDDPNLEPLILDIKRLWLPVPQWSAWPDAAETPEADWPDPGDLPPLWLDLADLRLGKQRLGRVRLRTEPLPGGLRIERLRLDGGPLHLQVKGRWQGRGRRQVSDLGFHLMSPDFGKVLRGLGIASVLAGSRLDAQGELTWAAPPYRPRLKDLAGTLTFKFGKGRLLEVDPGAGRWFGLVNFWAIRRRLTLDFSDLFKKGFGFDSMEGRVVFAAGQAQIRRFLLKSPAAEVSLRGSADLVKRRYAQIMEVTPNLSATLPVAGALAGGPLGAAVMVVADKLLGSQFDRIGQMRYRVTGPWAEPEVRPLAGPVPAKDGRQAPDNAQRVLDME